MVGRINALESCVSILSRRADEVGSETYMRARNKDLECQVRAQDREISRLKDDLEASERKIKDLNLEIRGFRDRIGSSGSSLGPSGGPAETGVVVVSSVGEKKSTVDADELTNRILKTVNEGLDDRMKVFQLYEDRIVGLMENLVDMRSNLVSWRNGSVSSLARSAADGLTAREESGQVGSRIEGVSRTLLKIIGNVQLAPPRGEASVDFDPRSMVEVEMSDLKNSDINEWTVMSGRRDRRQRSGSQSRAGPPGLGDKKEVRATPGARGGRTPMRKEKSRIPRVSAVSIKSMSDKFSYADILKTAKSSFSLRELGIESSKIQRSSKWWVADRGA